MFSSSDMPIEIDAQHEVLALEFGEVAGEPGSLDSILDPAVVLGHVQLHGRSQPSEKSGAEIRGQNAALELDF